MASQKGCCFWSLFMLISFTIIGYLMYSGFWLPLKMHKHCLRHSQLETFEIYSMDRQTWNEYDIGTEQLTIVSYKQEIPYSYQYILGSFIDIETNYSSSNSNELDIIPWNEFADAINVPSSPFIVIQFSDSKCINFSQCFMEYAIANNLSYDGDNEWSFFDGFIFTQITKKYKADINSELTGNILDFYHIRDVFTCMIMFILCIWIILGLDLFDNTDVDANAGWKMLFCPIFISLCYYLWIFTLSVIPILFVTPQRFDDLRYGEINTHSLTFTVGDYYAPWWISGVIMHGVWQWCIVLFLPFICVCYILIYLCCLCRDERTDKCAKCTILPFSGLIFVIVMLGCLYFIVLFVGNMTFWNDNTFVDISTIDVYNKYYDPPMIVLQIIIAFGLIIFLIPAFACFLLLFAAWLDRERDIPNGVQTIQRSVSRLPGIRSKAKSTRSNGGEYNTVPMTNYDVYN